eukprot:1336099-Amorphochlora_amoeboformis.AAC.2
MREGAAFPQIGLNTRHVAAKVTLNTRHTLRPRPAPSSLPAWASGGSDDHRSNGGGHDPPARGKSGSSGNRTPLRKRCAAI